MAKATRYTPDQTKKPFFLKGALLYILPFPIFIALFFALLNGDFMGIITNGVAFATFMLTASIARRGFLIEREYNKSVLAKAPKMKYKTIAAVMLTVGLFFTSYFATTNGLFLSILLALVAFIGYYLYYGLDPSADKVGELNLGVSAEEVIAITGAAKKRIEHIKSIQYKINDPEVSQRLEKIIKETTEVIENVEQNPNDLSRARKFFNVYLHRTEKITEAYNMNLQNDNIDEKMKTNYLHLLETVEGTIVDQKARLNEDDITSLDVQIEALTKQLKIEGV